MSETQPSGAERRRFPRTVVSMLVQYRFDTFEEFLAEYSTSLSLGGLFIATEAPRQVGAVIYLQFCLKDGSRLIEGMGRVVRVCPPGGKEPQGMGVEFVDLDPESQALLERLCGAPTT
jgi:uncharacterized protein (TIGR02266 family)